MLSHLRVLSFTELKRLKHISWNEECIAQLVLKMKKWPTNVKTLLTFGIFAGTSIIGFQSCDGFHSGSIPPGLPSGALTRHTGKPLVRNGPESYDFEKTGPRVVLKMGSTDYRMWYEAVGSDCITQVGYATSTDGLTWAKAGPVMGPDGSSWEKMEVSPNSVLYENGIFKMWYHGGGYFQTCNPGPRLGGAEIGFATSTDGKNWTKASSNPVLNTGPTGSFDDSQVAEPCVLNLGAGGYRMYYMGHNASTKSTRLAMATSTDGMTWTKYSGNPLLDPIGGGGAAIVFNDGVFNLWHATEDSTSGLNYKWSTDGITWTDGPSNPVLTPSRDSNTADASYAGDSVSGYLDGNTFRIMYTGYNSNFHGTGRLEAICLATIVSQ